MSNAINWFEIPVTDLARAKRFYGPPAGRPEDFLARVLARREGAGASG